MILAGWVGGASQTNGISQLIFPVPFLSVLSKVASQLLTFWKILEEYIATNTVAKIRYVC